MTKKSVVFPCLYCKTICEAEYSFFRRKARCPQCGKKNSIKKASQQVVNCPHCHRNVVFNSFKDKEQLCLSCGKPLFMESRYETVPCPKCGQIIKVDINEQECTCESCKYRFDIRNAAAEKRTAQSTEGIVVQPPFDMPEIIWHHPANQFPYASQLHVPDGMSALICINGKCVGVQKPGAYTLSDSTKSLEEKMQLATAGQKQTITTDIFFVKNNIDKSFNWGDAPADIQLYGIKAGSVRGYGNILLCVDDPEKFVSFAGFQTQTADDIIHSMEDLDDKQSKVVEAVHPIAFEGMALATQNWMESERGIKENGEDNVPDPNLIENKTEIKNIACDHINSVLSQWGLKISKYEFEDYEFTMSDEMKRYCLARSCAEKPAAWRSDPIHIHIKDDSSMSAETTLNGDCKLRLVSGEKFLRREAIRQFVLGKNDEANMKQSIGYMVTSQITNALQDVLQAVVDSEDVDIRALWRCYPYLRPIIVGKVNDKLDDEAYGLRVEQLTMQQESFTPSSSLEKLTALFNQMTDGAFEEKIKDFELRWNR